MFDFQSRRGAPPQELPLPMAEGGVRARPPLAERRTTDSLSRRKKDLGEEPLASISVGHARRSRLAKRAADGYEATSYFRRAGEGFQGRMTP